MTPKTRETTSPGTMRWTSVVPATSKSVFPNPTTASRTTATAGSDVVAISASGAPQSTTPMTNGTLSRRTPTSATQASAPMSAPTPNPALRYPTPELPRSRSLSATTTMKTSSAPSTSVVAVSSPISGARRPSEPIARKPAENSSRTAFGCVASGRRSVPAPRMRLVNAADQTISTAVTAIAAPGPDRASNMPPTAGPAKKPRLWIVDEATFAAVSSAGVVASSGINPANAGSAGVAARLTRLASV